MGRLFLLLTCVVFAVPAAADDSVEKGVAFAKAAFACAVLAAESSVISGNRAVASPLATKAAEKARAGAVVVLDALNADKTQDEGPLGDFIRTASPDFLTGLYFAEAQQEIDALLPKAGERAESYDDFKLRQETQADLEFVHRNCALIGG